MTDWTDLLLRWYDINRRDLPWRETKDPYGIWVSEIMLQQTRVEAVKPYFDNWMSQFPTMESVAEADEDEVLRAWQGLGYYSRARNLQRGLREVVTSYGGQVPRERKTLESIKGIGSYTAGAILSIAFNEREAAIDGNVLRIYARLYNMDEDILSTKGKKTIGAIVADTLPENRPGDFNEALMDFGSAVCIPKSPRCENCPLQDHCEAYKKGRTSELPVRKKKKAPKEEKIKVHLIRHVDYGGKTRFLLHKRRAGVLVNMWEFPTEAALEALSLCPQNLVLGRGLEEKECSSHMGKLQSLTHTFSHIKWIMDVYGIYDVSQGKEFEPWLALGNLEDWCWMAREDFTSIPWAGPHGKLTLLVTTNEE